MLLSCEHSCDPDINDSSIASAHARARRAGQQRVARCSRVEGSRVEGSRVGGSRVEGTRVGGWRRGAHGGWRRLRAFRQAGQQRATTTPPPILLTSTIASTLGESLNSLLAVLGLAQRLNASVCLPRLPSEQFSRSEQRTSTLDLGRILNLTRLASVLVLTRTCGDTIHSELAVRLPFDHTTGTHSSDGHQPALNTAAAWEALLSRILRLARRRSTTLVVHARMNGFSELGCGLCELQSHTAFSFGLRPGCVSLCCRARRDAL
jgi:hypothetical protein